MKKHASPQQTLASWRATLLVLFLILMILNVALSVILYIYWWDIMERVALAVKGEVFFAVYFAVVTCMPTLTSVVSIMAAIGLIRDLRKDRAS